MISNSIAFKSFYFFIISGEAIGCFFNIGLVIITMVRLRSRRHVTTTGGYIVASAIRELRSINLLIVVTSTNID